MRGQSLGDLPRSTYVISKFCYQAQIGVMAAEITEAMATTKLAPSSSSVTAPHIGTPLNSREVPEIAVGNPEELEVPGAVPQAEAPRLLEPPAWPARKPIQLIIAELPEDYEPVLPRPVPPSPKAPAPASNAESPSSDADVQPEASACVDNRPQAVAARTQLLAALQRRPLPSPDTGNPKAELSNWACAVGLGPPTYPCVQDGPPHQPCFRATACIAALALGDGADVRKVCAEVAGARAALLMLMRLRASEQGVDSLALHGCEGPRE